MQDDAHRIGLGHARRRWSRRCGAPWRVGQSAQHRQHVAEHVALVADNGEVDEAQVQAGVAPAAPRVVAQQPGAVVFRQVALEGVEQVVEVVVRRVGMVSA